jgi:malonyl-CoA O-methyltransferase
MLPPSIKQRVRESFDRAAGTYDSAARVQRHVCERLLEELSLPEAPSHILDAGCGTGYGARLLRARWPEAAITGVDFAPAMVTQARQHSDRSLIADIEQLPCDTEEFDLWWSSLSIQWCAADRVFGEAARVLQPGGQLALSTLGPDTFHELRGAFSGVDRHRHTLPFNEPEAIKEVLINAGFKNVRLLRERYTVHYPDLKTLLHAVKAIGAHNVGEGGRNGMMGCDAWKKLETAYEQFREPAGLPASYDVIFAYAKK